MDQYHLSETLDYKGNILNSNHHLMSTHQIQPHQNNQQLQYTQLHPSTQHRNNLNGLNNLDNMSMMNGHQKPQQNGTSNHNVQFNNGNVNGNHNNHNNSHNNNHNNNHNGNLNGNHNGNHNGNINNHNVNHNGNHNGNHSANHNGNHNNHNGNNIGSINSVHHVANVHHSASAASQHLNHQLLQLGPGSSPPQHQQSNIQHAQLNHDHLHSLETSPQITNLTNSNTISNNGNNQSMKRKLDEYLEPHSTNDIINDDESPMKKIAQTNGKKTKGRVKIKMEFIDNKLRRYTTFSKRKTGIMKKAYELSTLTGTQVMLLVASETGHVYTFATTKLQPMITSEAGKALIQTCLNSPDVPNNGLDQRMSATGFEETDLSYSIHDDSSEKDEDSSSSSDFLQSQNEDNHLKLNDLARNQLNEDETTKDKDDKNFFEMDNCLKTNDTNNSSSNFYNQQKIKKNYKNTQSENKKQNRMNQNCLANYSCNSPQSSCSSTSISPAVSPTNLFNHQSISLNNLNNNSVNNTLNSTNNRNSFTATIMNELNNKQLNSDQLNNSNASILPITFLQNAIDSFNKNAAILPSTSSNNLPLNQNLTTSQAVVNKQFNFKSNKLQQSSNQPTAQLSTLINGGNLLICPSSNTPTTLMYQASQGVVYTTNGSPSSSVFGDNLVLNLTPSSTANSNFDNSQFNSTSNSKNFSNSSINKSNDLQRKV